jgi:hypothetical protein
MPSVYASFREHIKRSQYPNWKEVIVAGPRGIEPLTYGLRVSA